MPNRHEVSQAVQITVTLLAFDDTPVTAIAMMMEDISIALKHLPPAKRGNLVTVGDEIAFAVQHSEEFSGGGLPVLIEFSKPTERTMSAMVEITSMVRANDPSNVTSVRVEGGVEL